MIQIRKGVFETNSSSSHSIAVRKIDGQYSQEEIEKSCPECAWSTWDGVLTFWERDLEFGRFPFTPLTTFFDKCKYAIATYGYSEELCEIEGLLYEFIPGLIEIKYPTCWDSDDEETYCGYVDHQSRGRLKAFLSKNNISLREFLLNKKYTIFVDGDEYHITEKLFDSGLMNLNDFEEVYPHDSDSEECI